MQATDQQKVAVAAICVAYGRQNVKHFAPDVNGRIRCELTSMAGTHLWYVLPDGNIDVKAGMVQRLFDMAPQPKPPRNAQDL